MSKINHILQNWPSDTVATAAFLKRKGVYKQLADVYKKSGWLERIGNGAYKKKGDTLSWEGGLYALQKLQNLAVHVGGRTALEIHGFSHYGRMSDNRVVLWKTPKTRLPSWFQKYDWEANINVRSATLFTSDDAGLATKKINQIPIILSTAERAILEYLHDVPRHEGFDEASYIMEGLASLRPKILQNLLETCKSIRAKRLFMYLAENYNHRWFERLDSSTIDLGKGKREIIKGGRLNKKYQIVVPELSREDQ